MSNLPRTLRQSDLDTFADISGDHNPIHIDADYAATTAFKVPVAHGMNLFSLAVGEVMANAPGRLLTGFSLKFPTPTPVGARVSVIVDGDPSSGSSVGASVMKDDDEAGLQGRFELGSALDPTPMDPDRGAQGETWIETRTFTEEDRVALERLTGEGSAPGTVPVGLLAGAFSKILGMDLPGRGTNYLKQQLRLHGAARTGEELTFDVGTRRVVADKRLVYLSTVCTGEGGRVVASGDALVLAHGRLPHMDTEDTDVDEERE